MISDKFFLQSPPIEVLFCGFTGTTYSLQSSGWELSMSERDAYRGSLQIAGRHAGLGAHLVSEPLSYELINSIRNPDYYRGLSIRVNAICRDVFINIMGGLRDNFLFLPIDATPRFLDVTSKKLSELALFAPLNYMAPQVYLEDEKTISEILDGLLEKQAPRQKELREKYRKQELEGFDRGRIPIFEHQQSVRGQLVLVGG